MIILRRPPMARIPSIIGRTEVCTTYLRPVMSELTRDLLICVFHRRGIDKGFTILHRRLHLGDIEIQVAGKLMAQAVRCHAQFLLRQADLAHHIREEVQRLLQSQPWSADVAARAPRQLAGFLQCLALVVTTDRRESSALSSSCA